MCVDLTKFISFLFGGRAPWPCGLIRHVLDQEIRGSNLGGRLKNFSYFRIEERKKILRKMMPRISSRPESDRKAEEISRKNGRAEGTSPVGGT